MKLFQRVLDKAKDEGKIQTDILPWEGKPGEEEKAREGAGDDERTPVQMIDFSNDILGDFKRIIENIRTATREKKYQVIGITSAVPGKGNTTLTALISLMTAGKQNGYFPPSRLNGVDMNKLPDEPEAQDPRVLLIDTQLKNPALHTLFQTKNEAGLCEVLKNVLSLEDVVRDIDPSRLEFITAGGRSDFECSVRDLENFRLLLDELRKKYEFIFLDMPPILHHAEGLAVSKLCDGVILVACAEETKYEVIKEAKKILDNAQVPVIGCVLNRRKYYIPDAVYRRL